MVCSDAVASRAYDFDFFPDFWSDPFSSDFLSDVSVLTLHNLRDEALEVELRVGNDGKRLANLLTDQHSEADGRGRHRIVLDPYGYRWYRVGGLTYLLDRTSD